MSTPIAFLNGRFVPQAEATLSFHDAGFVFGATITDFCRTFNQQLFRWKDHLTRFRHDCEASFIALPSDESLSDTASQLIAHNSTLIEPHEELALITFATPGPIGYYLGQPGGAGDSESTIGMHTFPLPLRRYQGLFHDGASLVVVGFQPVASGSVVDPRVKHRSRMLWWLAEQHLKQRPNYERGQLALLLDGPDGNVLETSFANVLFVVDGVLISPPSSDILDGIGLRIIKEIALNLRISMTERRLPIREVLSCASEGMLTGTAFGIAGVREVEGRAFTWPGPLTLQLMAEFADRANCDVSHQILSSR